MRIISQDGLSDYPYDNIFVWVDHVNPMSIGATICNDPNSEFLLGTYNSEKDALYVMSCIRFSMNNGYAYFHMPSAEDASIWRQEKEKRR